MLEHLCAISYWRQEDKNSSSYANAETRKLLANSSYGYQTSDRSRHYVNKLTNDENTHAAVKNERIKKLTVVNDQPYT